MIYAYLRVSTDDQDTANQRQHEIHVACLSLLRFASCFFNTIMPRKNDIARRIDIVFIFFIPT